MSAKLLVCRQAVWVGLGCTFELQRLPRSGRPQSGQDQGLPHPGRVPERPPSMQESLKESSPLLQEARQEVRRRIQRPSGSACLEVLNLEESIWARALRRFQGILQSIQQRCWDVLTWLWEKVGAFLEAVWSAVKAVCGMLMDMCSSVGQLFGNLIQV